jgi:hypothetical protein
LCRILVDDRDDIVVKALSWAAGSGIRAARFYLWGISCGSVENRSRTRPKRCEV